MAHWGLRADQNLRVTHRKTSSGRLESKRALLESIADASVNQEFKPGPCSSARFDNPNGGARYNLPQIALENLNPLEPDALLTDTIVNKGLGALATVVSDTTILVDSLAHHSVASPESLQRLLCRISQATAARGGGSVGSSILMLLHLGDHRVLARVLLEARRVAPKLRCQSRSPVSLDQAPSTPPRPRAPRR